MTTASKIALSVVMPAFNEESSIETVMTEHVCVLEKLAPGLDSWEIVCIDDGSSDGTPERLTELSARIPELRVIRQTNRGIVGAFSRGFMEARGTHVYATASDGQWPAENLARMFVRLQQGASLVVGVRTNRSEIYSCYRRTVSALFNLLPRVLFGVSVRDAGSIKLGVKSVFQCDLVSRSPFCEAERIIRARRDGYLVAFEPIQFLSRSGGKAHGATWKNVSSSVGDMLRCVKRYGLRQLPHSEG